MSEKTNIEEAVNVLSETAIKVSEATSRLVEALSKIKFYDIKSAIEKSSEALRETTITIKPDFKLQCLYLSLHLSFDKRRRKNIKRKIAREKKRLKELGYNEENLLKSE